MRVRCGALAAPPISSAKHTPFSCAPCSQTVPDQTGAVLAYTAVAVSGRVLAAMLAKLASSVKTGPIAVLQSQRIAQQCVGHVTPQ